MFSKLHLGKAHQRENSKQTVSAHVQRVPVPARGHQRLRLSVQEFSVLPTKRSLLKRLSGN